MTVNSNVRWIWRHIAITLPAEWEMLQFSTEYTRGRCAFADRHQFRVEMSWRVVKGEPDYDRMVSDYMQRLEQEKKLSDAERAKKAGWHGFAGVINRDLTSRFGRYLPEIGCLVEVVFLWPETRDSELERSVLSSIHAVPPEPRGYQQWRVFGMDLRVPSAAALEGWTAQPARAECAFTNPKTGNSWQFGRLGMVSSWFHGDLEKWVRSSAGAPVRELRFSRRADQSRDLLLGEGPFKPQKIHLRLGILKTAAWVCRQDGRLYFVRQWERRPEPGATEPVEALLHAASEFTPILR